MKFAGILTILFIVSGINTSKAGDISHSPLNVNKIVTLACPQIDDSQMVIYPSSCNTADGTITGITGTGTGTLTFTWLNGEKDIIGHGADLLNVAPGTYTLQVHDESKCVAAAKTYTVPPRNNIVIDESQLKIKAAGCKGADGSVTGLNISNAVQYQWFDAAKKPAGATPDLVNVINGIYTLTVTAADGCSTTKTYEVPSTGYFPKPIHIDTTIGTCNSSPGTITLTFNPAPTDPSYTYYGKNPDGSIAVSGVLQYGDGTPVKIDIPIPDANVPITLSFTDPSYCTSIIGQYTLPNPVFAILEGPFFLVRNDACGRKTGGVFGLQIVGETQPVKSNPSNQVWTWTDSLGNVVSNYPTELLNVGKGTYTVVVKDIGGCSDTKTFRVLDSVGEAQPPGINGATLCLPGTVTLSVINPNPKFKYKLYDSTQSTEITENDAGIFQQKVTHTTKYYVTTVNGLCESDETPVTVTVIAPGVIIPNTFTPNGDGINDYWDIPHIYDFPGAEISIFNRDGQLVFHSIDYSHPFNGNYNGKKLPVGVYYYVIDLKQPECFGKISGSLTIIR